MRAPLVTSLASALALLLVGCTGDTSGASRLTLTGTLATLNLTSGPVAAAARALPSALTFTTPPALTCYIASPGSTVWLPVSDGTGSSQTNVCALVRNADASLTVSLIMPSTFVGYSYAMVVVF